MGGLQFLDPQRLWLLLTIPFLVAAYIWAVRRKNRFGMRFTNTAVLGAVAPSQSQWRRHVAVALSLLSLVALVIAWARPNGVEKMPRERATVVLIVDTSLSMEATDVKPTRLAAAKQLSIEFAKSLPEQFNLALVSLSGNPAVRMPPTLDRSLAERAINALTPDESTAVGDAISTALSALKIAPKGDDGKPPPGAIVLLSDGQNTAGRSPMQAADNARKEKVPVYTIAYGSDNGWVDVDGKRERVPPDKEMLRSIAQLTGGRAWEAETASDLSQVYRGIRSQVGYEEVKKEVTATWAGYGLVFAVLAAMAAVSMGGEMAVTPLITFFHPERLWLALVVPLLLLAYLALIQRRRSQTRETGIDNLRRVLPIQAAWKRHVAVVAAVGSLASLVVAYAQPKDMVNVPRDRATVVLAIDVSRSMAAEDVKPNRLEAAKDAAQQFVNLLPKGFNVSLVAFAGTASVIVPPTTDRGMVNRAIENLQLAPATAIGEAIYSALDALALAPADPKHPDEPAPGSIVVLSDGFSNVGRSSAQAAEVAKKRGYAVHTIAYGTASGYVVVDGRREPVPFRPGELREVSRLSGGTAFTAGSSAELSKVYESIARTVGYVKEDREVTERYVGGAVALAVIASLAVLSLAARWP